MAPTSFSTSMVLLLFSLIFSSLVYAAPSTPPLQPTDTAVSATAATTSPKGPPVWSVPNLDIIFCPLRPVEPCPGLTVLLTINLAEGNYSLAGGEDVLCRTVIPFMQFGSEWHTCDNPKLMWRWEPRNEKTDKQLPWFFPITEGGETSIGIRMLEGPDDKDLLESTFKFRSTHIGKLAGGAPDAIVGCYIDPREPIRCSFNNMLLLGYEPPMPVLLNVTEVKGGAARA